MITYSIKKNSDDKSDILIEKTGGVVEFTLGKIDADVAYLEKAKKELIGQIGVNKATMENVKNTHPHIAEMTLEDLTAAYLYRQSMGVVNAATDKLAEVEKQLTDYAEEKVEILKQTGIVLSDVKPE